MSSGIPTQAEYERRELAMAAQHEREIDQAPRNDRIEAQRRFFEIMWTQPGLVAERISWLLDGNYGWGPMARAKQVLASPRMNRRAALVQSIAVHEWMCPRRMAVDAWKKLTPEKKQLLDAAVDVVIAAAEGEE